MRMAITRSRSTPRVIELDGGTSGDRIDHDIGVLPDVSCSDGVGPMMIFAVIYGAGAVALAFRRRPPGALSMMLLLAFLGTVLTDVVARH
jgi:hypothetical protein